MPESRCLIVEIVCLEPIAGFLEQAACESQMFSQARFQFPAPCKKSKKMCKLTEVSKVKPALCPAMSTVPPQVKFHSDGLCCCRTSRPEVICLSGQEATLSSFRAALQNMQELPQEAMVWVFFCGRGAGTAGEPRIVPTDAPSDCNSLEQELISQLVSRHTRPTTFERKRQAPLLDMVSTSQGCSAPAETSPEHLLHFPR